MCVELCDIYVEERPAKDKGVLHYDPIARSWVKLTGVSVSTIFLFVFRCVLSALSFLLWTSSSSCRFWLRIHFSPFTRRQNSGDIQLSHPQNNFFQLTFNSHEDQHTFSLDFFFHRRFNSSTGN
jgi:hypothetical protein